MREPEGAGSGPVTRTWEGGGGNPSGGLPGVPSRWRLVRKLGEGGQAEVWLAEDRELDELVALKIFGTPSSEASRERWRREVRLGRKVQHPNILRIHDLVESDGIVLAVMEAMPGGTVADRIVAGTGLPVAEGVRIGEAVLSALAYLHERGIVHRDVKPSNILFAADGTPKLGDLGLVRDLERDETLTATANVVGTPTYMAPEQLRGGPPKPTWDLYAFGVTLYEMLTGAPPFDGSSSFDVADAHLNTSPPPLRARCRECPRWLARFVGRLLEKDPADRWPSAVEAAEAFVARRIARSNRVRRRLVAGALGVLAAGALLAVGARGLRGDAVPATVQVVDRRVVALDDRGRVLWRYRPEGDRALARCGDFLPYRGMEVYVIEEGVRRREGAEFPPLAVTLLDDRGHPLASWGFPRLSLWEVNPAAWHVKDLLAADMDGDGLDEAAIVVTHGLWYPSFVQMSAVDGEGTMFRGRFANSGAIQECLMEDVNGDGVQDLVVSAFNNPLGFQSVVAAVDGRFVRESPGDLVSPDLSTERRHDAKRLAGYFLYYTPLGSHSYDSKQHLEVRDGVVSVTFSEGEVRLGPDGNPLGSALEGEGAELRARFWTDLAELCGYLRKDPVGWGRVWDRFRSDHPRILAEGPSDLAASLMVARALADAGAHRAAAELLEAAARRVPEERDLRLRLGEYRLIAGDRSGGRAALLASDEPTDRGRNSYDAYLLLALDAALHTDRAALDEAFRFLREFDGMKSQQELIDRFAPVLLFFEGRWNDPRYEAAVPAEVLPFVRWLLRWRELETGGDPERVLEEIRKREGEDDAREIAALTAAEALRRMGRVAEARARAEDVLASLERKGRRSYEAFVWVPLAEWELGRCLLDAGLAGDAVGHLRRAASLAPRTWFGRDAAARLAH